VILFCSANNFFQVYEVQLKSLSNWETEPLQNQVKTILSHILSEKNFRKVEKYHATKSVTFDDVTTFARRFLLEMTTECFFYGDVDVEKAEELSTTVLSARTKFLQDLAGKEELKIEKNPFLEDWFLTDPVEQIVSLETAFNRRDKNASHCTSSVGLGT